jgi:glycosyltransferase involved in cell wall biosynthesis
LPWAASTGRAIAAAARIALIVRRAHIDGIHCNSDTACLFGGLAARLTGRPYVWHRRDLVALGSLGRLMGRGAARMVAISATVAQAAQADCRRPGQLVTVPNGIDCAHFAPHGQRDRLRESLSIAPDTPVIACIGQLIPWKRQDAFIACAHAVAANHPRTVFLIVGDDLFQEHAAYVKRLHTAAAAGPANIMFCGYRTDIAAVMEAGDIILHLAAREPFGRVVAEAMAGGKPVIAAGGAGPSEIIEHQRSGILVPPDNIPAAAAAVADLLTDTARTAALGAAARHRIQDAFGLDRFAAQLNAVYKALEETTP